MSCNSFQCIHIKYSSNKEDFKKGYAYDAMCLLIEFATQKGYKIILQQVRTDNLASICLHAKLGYETDGQVYENQKGHKVLIYLMPLV